MKFITPLFSAASLLVLVSAAPSKTIEERAASNCGQWDTVQTGTYTVYNNLWGESAASSGSQCMSVDGLSGPPSIGTPRTSNLRSLVPCFQTCQHTNPSSAGAGQVEVTAPNPTPTPSSPSRPLLWQRSPLSHQHGLIQPQAPH